MCYRMNLGKKLLVFGFSLMRGIGPDFLVSIVVAYVFIIELQSLESIQQEILNVKISIK